MVGVPKLSFQKFGSVAFMVLANVPNIHLFAYCTA